MVYTTPTNKVFCIQHRALINATTRIQSENLHYFREARNLIARKSLITVNFILEIKKIMTQQMQAAHYRKVCRKQMIRPAVPVPTNTFVTTCCPYQHEYSYPITMNGWSSMHTPLLPVGPVPFYLPTTRPIYTTNYRPFIRTVLQPLLSPIVSQRIMQENILNVSNYSNEFNYSAEHINEVEEIPTEESHYTQEQIVAQTSTNSSNTGVSDECVEAQSIQNDPVESYLKLPKELFPSPRMLALDPNPIIDEFCKMENLLLHAPWLLDLEFGIPKSPITRPIPIYNVKFNNIHCKNTPDAIHPGFERCNPDFKRVLLFYYDCIVSAWYKGYMIMNCDRSVENFQSWLLLPMQVLGIGWP
ncbi:unnamed protein product [Arctia plantaginis]|uniref:Uncharacterized protein n=1 Tax=Arctia plantaginis TaxID=874455 RepID=A0A8S0Z370_ARCPL|nr:unnamed protein product [Arctia plantaginis]